jgi:hypothetical protein
MLVVALALTITLAGAAEKDLSSANFLIPYCRLTSKEALAYATGAFFQGQCFGMVRAHWHDGRNSANIPGNGTLQQPINVGVRYCEPCTGPDPRGLCGIYGPCEAQLYER